MTCLARGQSGEAPDGVRLVAADRWIQGAYDGVTGQDWDVVIEVSWQPELVETAVAALAARARHWVYVSSVSVYADHSLVGGDESAAISSPWEGSGEAGHEDYGGAKAACETAFRVAVPVDQLVIVRPGLIAGYGDPSDRFGYWPGRVARAQPADVVLTPPMEIPLQVIDVLDLSGWLVDLGERRTAGVFDAVGEIVTFGQLIGQCVTATGQSPTFVAADQDWLLEQGVEPWAGPESLPLWLPVPEYAGMMIHQNDAAKISGLSLRPLGDTARSALAWERKAGLNRPRKAGLSAEREADLLRAHRDAATR